MASTALETRKTMVHLLNTREENWASREVAVVVLFCVVFIVATGLLGLCISRAWGRRKAKRQTSNV
ncbi:hypothetical protein IFR05_008206 [Cadophora sp. M221]|nr:hypothetical protein IFR05_008206 [Cadophora sp. M221]